MAVILFRLLLSVWAILGCELLARASQSSEQHESCAVWQHIAEQLTSTTSMQQACQAGHGKPCTRIDCQGAYEYSAVNSFMPLESPLEVDYCFGIVLNHCDDPLNLDFYVQVPVKNVTFQTRIFHNTLLPIAATTVTVTRTQAVATTSTTNSAAGPICSIRVLPRFLKVRGAFLKRQRHRILKETTEVEPDYEPDIVITMDGNGGGLKYNLRSSGTAEGFLSFEMERFGNDITFSVTLKVRITNPMGETGTWAHSLQRKLISEETVAVPPCTAEDKKTSPKLMLGTCNPPHWKKSSKGFQYCDSNSYNKSCNLTFGCNGTSFTCNMETLLCECAENHVLSNGSCCSLSQFGSSCRSDNDCAQELNEVCTERSCSCASHYYRDSQKITCVASKGNVHSTLSTFSGVTPKSTGITFTPVSHKHPTSSSKAPVIIGAIVGGLLVLAGVLIAGYFAIRRLRHLRHRRDLLMENEDSDGVM